jgi:recyclin-1
VKKCGDGVLTPSHVSAVTEHKWKDGWKTLEPVKLYSGSRLLSKSPSGKKITTNVIFHGRLPVDLYDLILLHLPVYDIPQFSRCSRTLARVVKDGVHWEHRWRVLGVENYKLGAVLDDLEKDVINKNAEQTKVLDTKSNGPATLEVEDEGDFGDFSVVALNESTTGMFPTPTQNVFASSTPTPTNAFTILAPKSPTVPIPTSTTSNLSLSSRAQFIRACTLIKKTLLPPLSSPPHLILSTLFPPPNTPSISHQSQTLLLLLLFLSEQSHPIRSWPTLRITLKGAVDRFEAGLLTTFEYAHGKGDEDAMKEAAEAGWRVWWAARSGAERERVSAWEIGRVWIEKQEVFYDIGVRDALKNFSWVASFISCSFLLC